MYRKSKKEVQVFIEIIAVHRTYECTFMLDSCLYDDLKLVEDALLTSEDHYCFNENTLVYEKSGMYKLDLHMPLKSLHLLDGMWLVVY